MNVSKASTGKSRVTKAREGSTHTEMGKGSGKGAGVNKRDSAKNTSGNSGGGTLKYRSGDVKRSTGSFAKYK
jgi:hypothetical protein